MKIAATYDNGNIFQHFGRTENFKIYDVKDNKILSSEVISSNGAGHGALAGVLADNKIDVLICGGMGSGAQQALLEKGIFVITGAEGNADEAVGAFLEGKLESAGVNCDHHEEEEEAGGCGSGGCGSSCGSGCGSSCGSGCGGAVPNPITGPNVNRKVKVHYTGTFDDGTKFDSSYDRNQTLDFVCGAGMMIKGFDKAVANMQVGETVKVHLTADEAYGQYDPNAVFTIETSIMPGSEALNVGEQVYLSDGYGRQFPATVTAKEGTTITFDTNHEMAGKELNFEITLMDLE